MLWISVLSRGDMTLRTKSRTVNVYDTQKVEAIRGPSHDGGLDKTTLVVAAIELVDALLRENVTICIMAFAAHEDNWPEPLR